MAITKTSPKPFLGASIPNTNVPSSKIDEIIDKVNNPVIPVIDATSSTLTLTLAQSGSIVVFDRAAGVVITLPSVSSSNVGTYYDFIVETTVTSNSYTINTGRTTDLFTGGVLSVDDTTPEASAMFKPDVSDDDAMAMNGTTTGGKIGTSFRLTCIGANRWSVTGTIAASGVIATPFS